MSANEAFVRAMYTRAVLDGDDVSTHLVVIADRSHRRADVVSAACARAPGARRGPAAAFAVMLSKEGFFQILARTSGALPVGTLDHMDPSPRGVVTVACLTSQIAFFTLEMPSAR